MDLRTAGQCSGKIGQRQISTGATDLFPRTSRNGKIFNFFILHCSNIYMNAEKDLPT
jgi:hypothetical protein